MTDQELLELAAKAIGFDYIKDFVWIEDGFYSPLNHHERLRWNPLQNDDDAFRLVIKLEMSVKVHSTGAVVKDRYGCTTKVWTHPDPYVATRRLMNSNNLNYYTARERLRELAYGGKYGHEKSPYQSWGDFWKSR